MDSFAYEQYVIVVPTEWQASAIDIRSMIKSPLFIVWIFIIVLFTLLRKCFQLFAMNRNELTITTPIVEILLETYAIMFSTSSSAASICGNNRPERTLIVFLWFGSILASILCSGMLFDKLATNRLEPRMNSLADIYRYRGERYFCVPVDTIGLSRIYRIHEIFGTIEVMNEAEVCYKIYSGNQSCFYILPATKASRLLANLNKKTDGLPLFHIIPNTYLCTYI